MKLLDETWRCDGDEYIVGPYGSEFDGPLFETTSNSDEDIARARLAACAVDMAKLLLKLEIVGDGAGYCPACHVLRPDKPHAPACEWVAVLRRAGVLAS